MSLIGQQVFVTPGQVFDGIGTGGGGGGGSFSTINVSTIDLQPNGDINGSGSINFQMGGGGSMAFISSVSAMDGTTPAFNMAFTSPSGLKDMWIGLGDDGKAFVSTNANSINYLNPISHTYNGGSMSGLSTLNVSSISANAVTGITFPQQAVTTTPLNSGLTYVRGGQTAPIIGLGSQTAQHSYRIEFPVKIQGWNATDGLTNSYAPNPQDWISFYPQGNVVGNPTPVFNTLQMAQISSINNDWEGTVSGVWKTTANGAQSIVAATSPSVTYSTSVEIGAFVYVTDLGAI